MNVIICLDNSKGMLFNNRRQSRDEEVIKDIINNLNNEKLYINSFSLNLFDKYEDKVILAEDLLNKSKDETVFVENLSLINYDKSIVKLIVYCWNRIYPNDFVCDLDYAKFRLVDERDFKGKSHEKITKKTYVRIENE